MENKNIGIFPRLNSSSVPWQEKIKVAQHAWSSDDCIIPNKQQVLLGWVSQQLVDAYRKKNLDVVKDLWEYLINVLSSLESQINQKKSSYVLMPQLLQVFIEVFISADFETSNITLDALKCGQIILSNPQFNSIFVAKFENSLLYLSSLLMTFSNLNSDVIHQTQIHTETFCLIEISLNLYIPLQRRQTNHKKLFEKACQHLLTPIVCMHDACMSTKQTLLKPQEQCHRSVDLLHQALSDALFRKEHLSEYAVSLKALNAQQSFNDDNCQEPKPKKAKIGNYTKELFETLRSHCLQSKGRKREKVLNFLPVVLNEFLKARRCNNLSSSSQEFDFFTEMCSLLGLNFKEEEPPFLSCDHIGLVYTMLNALLTYDVYQVAEDNFNGKMQFTWFTGFMDILIKMPPSDDVFKCLHILLQLNHYIIEPYLTTLLQHCWTREHNQKREESSTCDMFLCTLVKTYTKLRQFDKFVGQMLKSITETTDMTSKWNGFPRQFQEEMVKACQVLPYGLATSLWNILNQEIIDNYLPSLKTLSPSKGKITNLEKKKLYCFERVIALYRKFLMNTTLGRAAEQHKTDTLVTNLTDLCCVMADKILTPAFDLLLNVTDNKLHKSLSTCVLVLYLTLQEMNSYLGRFDLITLDTYQDIASTQWNKYLLAHFNQNLKKKGWERLVFIKILIAVQRLRIYMRSSVSPAEQTETQQLVDFLFCWLGESPHFTSSTWNLQLWSIDAETFDAAYWFTLCSCAPILLTMCTDKQRQQFSNYVIKTLIQKNPDEMENNSVYTDINIQMTSKTLVFSSGFHQIPSMQQCFMVTLWTEIANLLSNSSSEIHNQLCKVMLSAGMVEDQVDATGVDVDAGSDESSIEDGNSSDEESHEEQLSSLKTDDIPSALKNLLPCGRTLEDVIEKLYCGTQLDDLGCETAKQISEHIALLTFLPLDWLSDVDHVRCFLALLACISAVMCQAQNKEVSEESLRVSFISQRLLSVILQGSISRKRYLVHHVINIDCLLSWMLMSYIQLTDIKDSSGVGKQLHVVSVELMEVFMKYALKIGKPTSLMDNFIENVVTKLESLTVTITGKSKKACDKVLKGEKCLLRIAGSLMNTLEKVISCKTSRLCEVKMAAHVFTKCAPTMLGLLQAIAEECSKGKKLREKDKKKNIILQDNHVVVDVYTAIVHVYSISQTSRKFSRSKETFQLLPWRPLFDWVLSFAVDSIAVTKQTTSDYSTDEKVQPFPTIPSLLSSLNFLNIIMPSMDVLQVDLPEEFHKDLLASVLTCLNSTENHAFDMKEMALKVIISMLQGCSSETAVSLLKELSDKLTNSGEQVSSCMQVWLTLLSGKFYKVRKKELRTVLPQVLMALQSIIQQSANLDLKILSLELITKILALGTSMVFSHHSSLIFHGSLLVPLDHSNPRFPELFQTQFSLLSTALFHHSEAIFKTMHVFISCVKNMLNGLCQYCNDKKLNETKERTLLAQTTCADKMSRLYQEIASHKAAVSKYLPYMIAEYIQQIQQNWIQENIKKLLVPGVYCLIEACGEHEIALLHTTLDRGSRELFISLNNDYNKFHKFKGKV